MDNQIQKDGYGVLEFLAAAVAGQGETIFVLCNFMLRSQSAIHFVEVVYNIPEFALEAQSASNLLRSRGRHLG